ncbi:helix-turn-helix transcriptional regulator [Desulfovibrio sp. OttesenSCG-928-G11]|nr:helix-turn-helix transcriptional regulator [Desulfovibrio sp. OttesenSCG-928-G11]
MSRLLTVPFLLFMNKRMGRPVSVPGGETAAARLRRLKGWSQAQMAAEFGVSQPTIGRWERGEMEPGGPAKKLLERLLSEAGAD